MAADGPTANSRPVVIFVQMVYVLLTGAAVSHCDTPIAMAPMPARPPADLNVILETFYGLVKFYSNKEYKV